jgi:hypothetical protein
MSLKDEAAILLAELLRLPPEHDNETVTAFIETMTKLAVAEMQRRPFTPPRLGEGGLINKVSGTTYKYIRGESPLVDFFADKLNKEEGKNGQ